jgi:hypothetical protein
MISIFNISHGGQKFPMKGFFISFHMALQIYINFLLIGTWYGPHHNQQEKKQCGLVI